uniref:Putative dna polymerase delta n=1 Tax=Hyalomma excavatum TaxID=257692 RepID=A0A131XLR4_9ACAR
MVSSRLANRLGAAGGPRRRPVTDAREVLNARAGRATTAPALAARRLGVATRGMPLRGIASRGIVKTGGRLARGGLRLNTMRSDLVAGGSGLHSDRILAATRRNLIAQTRASPRFQVRNLRQSTQISAAGMVNQRRGLISGTRRLAAMQQIQAAQGDIDERPQQGLFGGRAGLLEEEDDDDLERLTLDNILGRSPFRAAQAAVAAATAASLGRSPRATSSLSRIQHRLDGGGLGSPSARSPSDPLPGCSVLVANLHPQVTESDIRDLFQYIGPMHDARMVAVGTALATFHRQSDAKKAFKAYNGRMLDGQPMNLTVLTLDVLQSNQR